MDALNHLDSEQAVRLHLITELIRTGRTTGVVQAAEEATRFVIDGSDGREKR